VGCVTSVNKIANKQNNNASKNSNTQIANWAMQEVHFVLRFNTAWWFFMAMSELAVATVYIESMILQ